MAGKPKEEIDIPEELLPELQEDLVKDIIYQFLHQNEYPNICVETHTLNDMEFRKEELEEDEWEWNEYEKDGKSVNGMFLISENEENIIYFSGDNDEYYTESILKEFKGWVQSKYKLSVYTQTDWSSIRIETETSGGGFVLFG